MLRNSDQDNINSFIEENTWESSDLNLIARSYRLKKMFRDNPNDASLPLLDSCNLSSVKLSQRVVHKSNFLIFSSPFAWQFTNDIGAAL